jgi:hypothetical protein
VSFDVTDQLLIRFFSIRPRLEKKWEYNETIDLALMIMLLLCGLYESHISHIIEISSLCTIYNSSVHSHFAEIMSILCYNASLVT